VIRLRAELAEIRHQFRVEKEMKARKVELAVMAARGGKEVMRR
jgi:hypothetical protein